MSSNWRPPNGFYVAPDKFVIGQPDTVSAIRKLISKRKGPITNLFGATQKFWVRMLLGALSLGTLRISEKIISIEMGSSETNYGKYAFQQWIKFYQPTILTVASLFGRFLPRGCYSLIASRMAVSKTISRNRVTRFGLDLLSEYDTAILLW